MSKDKLQWLKAAGIRAVKTIAQTAVATIGTATVLGSVTGRWSYLRPFFPAFYPCLHL